MGRYVYACSRPRRRPPLCRARGPPVCSGLLSRPERRALERGEPSREESPRRLDVEAGLRRRSAACSKQQGPRFSTVQASSSRRMRRPRWGARRCTSLQMRPDLAAASSARCSQRHGHKVTTGLHLITSNECSKQRVTVSRKAWGSVFSTVGLLVDPASSMYPSTRLTYNISARWRRPFHRDSPALGPPVNLSKLTIPRLLAPQDRL